MSYVVKELKDEGGSFWLGVFWREKSFSLTVVKEKNAYRATITSDYLEKQSKFLKHDFDQYCDYLKQYLQGENANVCISFKEQQRVLEVNFVISSGSSVKYFRGELTDSDYYESVQNIINKLNTESTEAFLKIKTLQEENAALKNDLAACRAKLEEFVKLKRQNDKEMISNFALLLNEKKTKIQYLTELLEAFRNGREIKNPPVTAKQSNTINSEKNRTEVDTETAKKEVISESESEESTEEECDSEEEKRKMLDELLAVPSTSKADFEFLKEDTPPREMPKIITPTKNKTDDSFLLANKKDEVKEDDKEATKSQNDKEEMSSLILKFNTQDMLDEL